MRENRTHGSEGGDGESRSRPLSSVSIALVIYADLVSHTTNLDSGVRRNDERSSRVASKTYIAAKTLTQSTTM